MEFEQGYIFHIYNQGNNRETVFFKRDNYFYFLKKIADYVKPYGDILAWCLMPNHFHLMVLVNRVSTALTSKRTVGVARSDTDGSLGSDTDSNGKVRNRSLNDSIGIMLRSYTNAINKQEKRSGKLFREKTKAECINCSTGITPSFYNTNSGALIHVDSPEKEYPQACFNYIHQNPLKAGLVSRSEDWEFSSFRDYLGIRDGKLVNKKVAAKYVTWE